MLLEHASPLVMTSANHEGIPIITEDEDAFALCGTAGVLYNERRISVGLDDSVVSVPAGDGKLRLIRRSKGFVPSPIYVPGTEQLGEQDCLFAAGGHLKSAFALTKGSYVYLSPHLGDMENIQSEQLYQKRFAQMKDFFEIEPTDFVADMHPRYYPTQFAKACAPDVTYVQHHHAHIASVMAEHGLTGPVIGVAFDGTGYGDDGSIWGGEVLICEGTDYERFSHLKYVDMPGGDDSMREGWKAAFAHKAPYYKSQTPIREFRVDIGLPAAFADAHGTLQDIPGAGLLESMIARRLNTTKTSSMGRLFDAVSAMLGICQTSEYEGECAIMLENAARAAQLGSESKADLIAFAFHEEVAAAAASECTSAWAHMLLHYKVRTKAVCLSGGVFQNRLLLRMLRERLEANGFEVFLNEKVPCNDGGIALGQAYIAMLRREGGKDNE
jgi:hydrogenase maturation protein HypF